MKRLLPHLMALGCLIILFLASLAVRIDALVQVPSNYFAYHQKNWTNESFMHFLDPLIAYRQVPLYQHKYLPQYSHNRFELDAGHAVSEFYPDWINDNLGRWVAFRADRWGNTTYLSFPPGSFMTVDLILRAFQTFPSYRALQYLNLALHFLYTLGLYAIIFTAIRPLASSRMAGAVIGIGAASVYLFSSLTLHAHNQTFWAHHIFQGQILLALLIFLRMRHHFWRPALLGLVALWAAYTEWTAYLLNFILFILSLILAWRGIGVARMRHLWSAAALAAGQILSMGILALIYQINIGLDHYFDVMTSRFGIHLVGQPDGGIGDLLRSIFLSYGPYAIAAAVIAIICRLIIKRPILWRRQGAANAAIALCALGFILLENLMLSQHAVAFSFAQMKGVYFIALALAVPLAVLTSQPRRHTRAWALGLGLIGFAGGGVASVAQYAWTYGNHVDRNSGKRIYDTVCMTQLHDIGRFIRAHSDPRDDLVFINVLHYFIFLSGDLGDRPIVVDTPQKMRDIFARSSRPHARLFILSGQDFDMRGDRLFYGRVSAELILSKDSDDVRIHLYPTGSDTARPSDPGQARFHTDMVFYFLTAGQIVQDESGRPYRIDALTPRTALYMPLDSQPLPPQPPRFFSFTLPSDQMPWSQNLLVRRGSFRQTGCDFDRDIGLFKGINLRDYLR